ncbi:MAG: UDP-N-acetylmuramoyl-L-alanyl-D-glutamate--2,6-diaminopimelate ligase [Elusimicrobia bacterium]|nr:UDP-N-acetylmuramoyl-L-alanyl-D-glutamate--2,6-diaminopimelate ligase [Candidatus Liberimonas magnetica]
MKLKTVLNGLDCEVFGDKNINITGITHDSRKIKPGNIFVALSGYHADGKSFIGNAINSGAKVVVTDEFIDIKNAALVVVSDIRRALAYLSSNFYSHPDKKLLMIGVTGTNGKTTITYLLENILNKVGIYAGVIGTVNYRFRQRTYPTQNTTPESSETFKILNDMVKSKCGSAIMEVSSHALYLGRVNFVEFDIALFTNLTRDHLDFHKTMEDYFEAKKRLFLSLQNGRKSYSAKPKRTGSNTLIPKFAIINIDDPWGKKLIREVKNTTVITYGLSKKADIKAKRVKISSKGTEFFLETPAGKGKVHVGYLGMYNVYNVLASVGAALGIGISLENIIKNIKASPFVPGRLEKVSLGQSYTVVVDYAHTDDALKNVLAALRQLPHKRLITVFGCGGDRDRTKRPVMGDIATRFSDYVFVTSDNPRSEDPSQIALDIEVGIRRHNRNNYQVVLDREQAISTAVAMAQKGDIILLAGKGHETYQILKDQKIHFNDAEIAKKYISKGKL